MTPDDFLNEVINKGIAAAKIDYENSPNKREGAIAGFEACRGKSPEELFILLEAAKIATRDARLNEDSKYWWFRCYESEVEWVCNCVSVVLVNEKLPPIITPTARGFLAAASIVGIKD